MENKIRVIDAVQQLHRLGTGVNEVGLLGGERLQTELHATIGDGWKRPAKRIEGVLRRLLMRTAGGNTPLGRRAEN